MAATPSSQPSVKSAMRTLDLIEYVVAHPGGVAAQELASSLAIPVSSLSYLLTTLVDRGYLERNGRRYHAGPGIDRLLRPQEERSFADRARPLIKALRVKLNETASLFVPVGWEMEAVVTETAEQTLRYSIDVGVRTPLHCVAAGKAMLAAFPEDELERYLRASRREALTERTIVSRVALMKEIETVRRDGFARTRDEYTVGISGVGAAVRFDNLPVGAVSVGVPSSRLSPDKEPIVVEQVRATCRALEDVYRACVPVPRSDVA